MESSNINKGSEPLSPHINVDAFVMVSESNITTTCELKGLSEELNENCDDERIEHQIIKIEKDFKRWTELRRTTISNLREIAEYIGKLNIFHRIKLYVVFFILIHSKMRKSHSHFYRFYNKENCNS